MSFNVYDAPFAERDMLQFRFSSVQELEQGFLVRARGICRSERHGSYVGSLHIRSLSQNDVG